MTAPTQTPTPDVQAQHAQAAACYAGLVARLLHTVHHTVPETRAAADLLRVGDADRAGDLARADVLSAYADRMAADPIGCLLGRHQDGEVRHAPDHWPFTIAEFRPSNDPNHLLGRAIQHIGAAAGVDTRPTVNISGDQLESWLGRPITDDDVAALTAAITNANVQILAGTSAERRV